MCKEGQYRLKTGKQPLIRQFEILSILIITCLNIISKEYQYRSKTGKQPLIRLFLNFIYFPYYLSQYKCAKDASNVWQQQNIR